jgi:outer membrane protein OmpA-like peptidoglycan-associated protein
MDMLRAPVRFAGGIGLIASLFLMLSCTGLFSGRPERQTLPFKAAIDRLSDDIIGQVVADSGDRAAMVVVDPFVDADSGEVPRVSLRIEELLMKRAEAGADRLQLSRLTSENQGRADYMISGSIELDSTETGDVTIYRVFATARNLRQNRVVGNSSVWVSDPDLDYASMAIYQDTPFFNPVYLRERLPEELPRKSPGAVEEYSLETRALLREASTAYEKGAYDTALSLFTAASERPDAQSLWTYAGLYLAQYKLGRLAEADRTFAKIVSISVEDHRMLTVRFLFKVNSVNFPNDARLRERYAAWLKHIGAYFQKTDYCLQIVGHCSKTGPETYNERLSLDRAKRIQQLLRSSLPDTMTRTTAIGKGSRENVVGIGTDDERDILDRRVELVIVDCK